MTLDLVIENGLVVDGTGAGGQRADLGITGKGIAAIGDLKSAAAARRLDATNCVVAPGFTDIHNHSDLALLADGRAESMIRQGVTTQVIGNCGVTAALVHGVTPGSTRDWEGSVCHRSVRRLVPAPSASGL